MSMKVRWYERKMEKKKELLKKEERERKKREKIKKQKNKKKINLIPTAPLPHCHFIFFIIYLLFFHTSSY